MNPPSSKRYRDISLQESAMTTPRLSDSPLRLLQMVDKRLDNHKEEIQKAIQRQLRELFEESETRLLDKIEHKLCERFDKMRSDLVDVDVRVTKLESKLEESIKSMNEKLEEFKASIELQLNNASKVNTVCADDIILKSELEDLRRKMLLHENNAVACDLRIDGIPYYDKEDIYGIFCAICSSINIDAPNVRAIYRLKNNKNASVSPTILVKLCSPYEKNFILKSATNYRRRSKDLLRLTRINFDSEKPFYINENLSHTNYKIFNKAMKMKKEKLIHSVFTARGLVHIIKEESGQPKRIDNLDDLNILFRDNASETMADFINAVCNATLQCLVFIIASDKILAMPRVHNCMAMHFYAQHMPNLCIVFICDALVAFLGGKK